MYQGVANINFRYEWIFEYIFFQKTIRTNIRIYSYQKNDTNEYPNIFVSKKWYECISEYIRINKMIWTNIRIYSYQTNDTNMIRTNIRIGKYSNVRIHLYQIFDIGVRFDVICWIFDVWYNKKHSWHNKMEVICLWILICVWTILDLLVHTLDFSLEYIRIKKRYERISEYIRIKNDTNEYPNNYVSKKQYERISEYICIKKMIRIWYKRIFVSENIRIYSNIRIFATP